MLYCSWDMARVRCNFIFHFGLFFALLLPWQPKNQNLKKMKKNAWRYHHFTYVYQKLWIMIRWCTIPEIWCATEGRTDGKSDIWRWVPHLKNSGTVTQKFTWVSDTMPKFRKHSWANFKKIKSTIKKDRFNKCYLIFWMQQQHKILLVSPKG